jgi:hypothetical protein
MLLFKWDDATADGFDELDEYDVVAALVDDEPLVGELE